MLSYFIFPSAHFYFISYTRNLAIGLSSVQFNNQPNQGFSTIKFPLNSLFVSAWSLWLTHYFINCTQSTENTNKVQP